MSWWSDLIEALNPLAGAEASTAANAGGAITAAGDAGSVIAGVWTNVRDYKMWRSLGWLVLGIILMLLGAAWWIGPSAERASPVALAAEGLG